MLSPIGINPVAKSAWINTELLGHLSDRTRGLDHLLHGLFPILRREVPLRTRQSLPFPDNPIFVGSLSGKLGAPHADFVGDLVADRIEPVRVSDQRSAQMEPVGGLDHLGRPTGGGRSRRRPRPCRPGCHGRYRGRRRRGAVLPRRAGCRRGLWAWSGCSRNVRWSPRSTSTSPVSALSASARLVACCAARSMSLVVREQGHAGEHAHPALGSRSDRSPWAKTRVRNRSKRACRIWASTLAALTPGPACRAAFFRGIFDPPEWSPAEWCTTVSPVSASLPT